MKQIDLAMSPCPNDTFIFGNLILNGCGGLKALPFLEDVEKLNSIALTENRFSLTKLSFFALLKLEDTHTLLSCGGALGRGCGPLLVHSEKASGSFFDRAALEKDRKKKILIPGENTTAALLCRLFLSENSISENDVQLIGERYDRIIPALVQDPELAGLIIHEERFTYEREGLTSIQDLGAWWEKKTGLPIPLGGIGLKKELEQEKEFIENAVRLSLKAARDDFSSVRNYIKENSQCTEDSVIHSHIELYVNEFSENMGTEGYEAVDALREFSRRAGLI